MRPRREAFLYSCVVDLQSFDLKVNNSFIGKFAVMRQSRHTSVCLEYYNVNNQLINRLFDNCRLRRYKPTKSRLEFIRPLVAISDKPEFI